MYFRITHRRYLANRIGWGDGWLGVGENLSRVLETLIYGGVKLENQGSLV
jgi:hypothetical protein